MAFAVGRVSRAAALPAEYTSFVDRREQLARAREQLGEGRLLTVVGAGGIGKTRFAVRLAGTMRRVFGDDVWFVDLTAVASGGSVADQVATNWAWRASDAIRWRLSPGSSADAARCW